MPTLLLIHGGWCASWVWDRLGPELHKLNIAFETVDLPGHESHQSRLLWPVSLDDYTGSVIEAADAIEGPVIAVGHSMGGFVMTVAASRAPQAFDQLVYLSGFVPVDGERFMNLARGDKESLLGSGVRPNPLLGRLELHKSVWHDALFHDCDEEDERNYANRYVGQPLRPGLNKLRLSDGLVSIPKSFLLCSNDRAISAGYQRWMADRSGIPIKHELPSGHMPMFAIPTQLAEAMGDCL